MGKLLYVAVSLLFLKGVSVFCLHENFTELSIIHINDFHARYEETSVDSGLCKNDNCVGGFSRLYTCIKNYFEQKPNSILLNAGDNFEGTLWYNVHKWNVTQHFFNKLPVDAYTLGNHEFDDQIGGLVPFLEHLKAPVVVANIDASQEPSIKHLISKSVIIEKNRIKIGVIGVILSTIDEFADIGNLLLLDESESVNAEAERLVREENVFTNIVLSHCGYDVEKELARKANSKISLIVGGHSHTFLYNGKPTSVPDKPMGPYPTVVQSDEGKRVLVVQASSYNKYVGNISIFYDGNGDVINWTGNPIFLDNTLPQDQEINEELLLWKEEVDRQGNRVVGHTLVRLDQAACSTEECLIGNFITDAMIFGYSSDLDEPNALSKASIAVIHSGGLRSGIDVGNITYNEIVAAQPFKNTIDIAEIKGKHLKEIFESTAANNSVNLLQVSGLQIVYNLSMPEGRRVTSFKLRCRECKVPVYEDLQENENYRLILPSYLARGGFGFYLFKKYLQNRQIGELDINLIVKYTECKSPIFLQREGRIQIYR